MTDPSRTREEEQVEERVMHLSGILKLALSVRHRKHSRAAVQTPGLLSELSA